MKAWLPPEAAHAALWGRRSRFERNGLDLLVAEVFLPALWQAATHQQPVKCRQLELRVGYANVHGKVQVVMYLLKVQVPAMQEYFTARSISLPGQIRWW